MVLFRLLHLFLLKMISSWHQYCFISFAAAMLFQTSYFFFFFFTACSSNECNNWMNECICFCCDSCPNLAIREGTQHTQYTYEYDIRDDHHSWQKWPRISYTLFADFSHVFFLVFALAVAVFWIFGDCNVHLKWVAIGCENQWQKFAAYSFHSDWMESIEGFRLMLFGCRILTFFFFFVIFIFYFSFGTNSIFFFFFLFMNM